MSVLLEIRKSGRRHYLWLKCDHCGTEFECTRYKYRDNEHHFCKRECSSSSRSNGIVAQKVQKTNLERYGALYGLSKNSTIRHIVDENADPYANSQKWLQSKGLSNISQLPDHLEKCKKTSQERYGVDHPTQSTKIKEKTKATNREKYGRDYYMGSDEFIQKTVKTNREKYGVDWATQSTEHMAKVNVDWESARVKRHETMKREKSFKKSRPEETIYATLCAEFGTHDVEREVLVNKRWPIDFYVKSLDVHVQYDSYWHGYDCDGKLRDISEVAEFKTKRDVMIHRKMLIDVAQNEWFKLNDKTLVRIICSEYKTNEYVEKLKRSSKVVSVKNKEQGNGSN